MTVQGGLFFSVAAVVVSVADFQSLTTAWLCPFLAFSVDLRLRSTTRGRRPVLRLPVMVLCGRLPMRVGLPLLFPYGGWAPWSGFM